MRLEATGSVEAAGAARLLRRLTLPVAIAVTCGSLFVGLALHAPCVSRDWSSGIQYTRLCYTDLLPLYGDRGLAQGRIPYLDAPNEYPVLTGAFIAATGLPARSAGSYFAVSVLGLSVFAVLVTWLLFGLVRWRALVFAAAPTLVVYSFVNWDLIAVAFAVAAMYAFLRRRDRTSGVLLGLGAAAKVYPGLFVLPFAWSRWREGDRRGAARIVVGAVAAWTIVNAPVAIAAPRGWSYFFRFNAGRAADWGSLWATGCRLVTGATVCRAESVVNAGSLIAFVAAVVAVAVVWSRRALPPWTAAFGLTVAFLLANKVYSPQYSLWLLPWFALLLPDVRLFALFELADVTVFVTHFSWQARLEGFGGLPLGALEISSLVRAAAILAILVAYVRTSAGANALQPLATLGTSAIGSPSSPR